MPLLKQSSTAQPLVFLLVLTSDHISGATGLTPTVTLSKNGGAFASPSGAVTEIANGLYKVAGNATDTNTLGPLWLHATGTGADPVDMVWDVVAYDPQDAVHLGIGALPNTNCTTNASLLTSGTGTDQLSVTSGRIDIGKALGTAVTLDANNVLNVSTKYIGGTLQTARDLGASVLLSAGTGTGQLDFTSGVVKSNLAQILGTALTETAGFLAAGFKKFFNVSATPASTMDHLTLLDTVTTYTGNTPQTGDSYARLGAPAGASVSADVAALQTSVNNINNLSALANLHGPQAMEVPISGSIVYPFTFVVKDAEGHLLDLSGTPTVTAANGAGTDRSANLSAVTHAGTGQYTFTYTVLSSAAEEGLTIKATGTASSDSTTRLAYMSTAVVAVDTATSIAAIKAQTDKLTFTGANNLKSDVQTILGTTSAGTPGYMAPDWGHVNAPTTVVDLTNTTFKGIDAQLPDWPRPALNGTGSIWYVTTTGSDSNNGQTWATAFLTIPHAIGVAKAGDTIDIGAGTFALGNAVLNLPDGINIVGQGPKLTTITSTADLDFLGAIVAPGNGSIVAHLGIAGVGSGVFQAPFGFYEGAITTPQTQKTNWLLDDCYLTGDSDAVYIHPASGSPAAMRGTIRNTYARTLYDSFTVICSNAAWDCIIDFDNCDFQANGPSIVGAGSGTSRAIVSNTGTVRLFGGYFAAGGSSTTNNCVDINSGCTVYIIGATLNSYGTSAQDINNSSSTVIVSGTVYNSGKTTGVITVKTISTYIMPRTFDVQYEAALSPFDVSAQRVALDLDAAVSSRMATFTLPANFAAMAITAGGVITANTTQLAGQTVTAASGVTFPSSVGTSTLTQAQVTGGAYALHTDGSGNVNLAASQHVIADSATLAASQPNYAPATNADMQTVLGRIGAWTGTGNNTVLGAFRALGNKMAGLTPTDLTSGGGTFDNTEDSNEAIRDRGDVAWLTGSGGGGGGGSGSGATPVTENTGGTDNLRAVDANGNGLPGVVITAYLTSDYNSSPITAVVQGQIVTKADGRFTTPLMLTATLSYTLVYEDQGFRTATKTVTP